MPITGPGAPGATPIDPSLTPDPVQTNVPADPPAAPATPALATPLSLRLPKSPDQVQRADVGRKAAGKLLDTVVKHKDVQGTGQESAAGGDPRVTSRRSALSTLMAQLKGDDIVAHAALEALGERVKADVQWLKAADRSEYKVDGGEEQFSWAESDFSKPEHIQAEFDKRIDRSRDRARMVESGQSTFLDVSDNSVIGLAFVEDPDKRAAAMMDTLLQFRARTDKQGSGSERIDRVAPVLVAEQRILLAQAKLDGGDLNAVRELALLREIIAAHPTSSVNGVFEARNSVGQLFLDGGSYGDDDHTMAWVKTQTAPGATDSAYEAIHHNFSRDTPGNLEATYREWVFPLGPPERRAPLFLTLADVVARATAGDNDGAKSLLTELDATDKQTLAGLLPNAENLRGEALAASVANFLFKNAQKPLAENGRTRLTAFTDKAKTRWDAKVEADAEVVRTKQNREDIKVVLDSAKTTLDAAKAKAAVAQGELDSAKAAADAQKLMAAAVATVPDPSTVTAADANATTPDPSTATAADANATTPDPSTATAADPNAATPDPVAAPADPVIVALEQALAAANAELKTAESNFGDAERAYARTDWPVTRAERNVGDAQDELESLRREIVSFIGEHQSELGGLKDNVDAAAFPDLAGVLSAFTGGHPDLILSSSLLKNIGYFAGLYRAVCADQPSADSLERSLFKGGSAWPEVADVIAQMRDKNDLGTLKDLGEARLALRDAMVAAKTGYERHEIIKLDAEVARLTCSELGAAVDRVGSLKTDEEKVDALVAVQTALRSAVASGLHALFDPKDKKAQEGRQLPEVLAAVDAAMTAGTISEDGYRALMADVFVSVARTVQSIRSYADARAVDVAAGHNGKAVELDPMFLDQFVKQSPLHYATALAEKGMRAGLKEEIGPRYIANVEGMRVLNSVGPVVFTSAVFAENTKDLIKLKPARDALSILYALEEKKMVAVGGLITDTAHAPGGNSHLNMYAMNNGIPVVALPELRTKYAEFFATAQNEGGIYIDDTAGQFRMMTVAYAKEQGLVDDAKLKELRPGTNKRISYLKPGSTADTFELIAKHESILSPTRPTREIELYVGADEVQGVGRECTSFADLAKLGIQARHLAGEKGTVLALLRANPALAKYVPDGSQITTGRVRGLLREAGIMDAWEDVWRSDPKVGTVDDNNFTQSAFYTDPDYRAGKREHLQKITKEKLEETLLGKAADGTPTLTANGEQLYAELMRNTALSQSKTGSIILRSSFTGEDRPGKSGAGQYESYVDRKIANQLYGKDKTDEAYQKLDAAKKAVEDAKNSGNLPAKDKAEVALEKAYEEHNKFMGPARVHAAIGVIESTWMAEPIENNVADGINLQHIECSVVVQDCLTPSVSGVMISRDTEHGTRNQVSYQIVRGFGGGVDGGKAEEGVISASGHSVRVKYPDAPDGLVTAAQLKELRTIVLEVEKYFHEVIEKGKGHAVDMEVAMQNGEWKIVQARVILMDK